jgi:hypothetical protein
MSGNPVVAGNPNAELVGVYDRRALPPDRSEQPQRIPTVVGMTDCISASLEAAMRAGFDRNGTLDIAGVIGYLGARERGCP